MRAFPASAPGPPTGPLAGLLICAVLLAGCAPQVQRIPFDDGTTFVESHWKDGVLDGEFRQYHPGGQLARAGLYRGGLPDGEWKSWYPSGQQETREEYARGVRTGLWTEWYTTGDRRAEGRWVDGDRDGLWQHWSPEGDPGSEALWERGTRVSVRYFQ